MSINDRAENTAETNQYLTFTLADEDFALDIGKVREVLDYTTITKVPRMPAYLRGVINLRGNVVPVIDLRYKLGMGAIKQSVDTCIVIFEIMIDNELTHMGALADSVKEVIDLSPDQISPPPKLGVKINNEFLRGMGCQDERFLIILDIDKVLTADELDAVQGKTVAQETIETAQFDESYPLPEATPTGAQLQMEESVPVAAY